MISHHLQCSLFLGISCQFWPVKCTDESHRHLVRINSLIIIHAFLPLAYRHHRHSTATAVNYRSIAIITPSIRPKFPTMPPLHTRCGGRGDRILLHTCDTDDSTPTVVSTEFCCTCRSNLCNIWSRPHQTCPSHRPYQNPLIYQLPLQKLWWYLQAVHMHDFSRNLHRPGTLLHWERHQGPQVLTPFIFLLFFLRLKKRPMGCCHPSPTCPSFTMP